MNRRIVSLNGSYWSQVSELRKRAELAATHPTGHGLGGAGDLDRYHSLAVLDRQYEQLLAYLVYSRSSAAWEILDLAVDPEHQRMGHMTSLLRKALCDVPKGVDVWLEVHEANLPALGLYRKWGFIEVGRRAHYYRDQGAAVLMSYDR